VVVCTIDGNRSDGTHVGVTLRLSIDASPSDFNEFEQQSAAQGFTMTNRTDVGEEAFTYSYGPTSDPLNALAARKGQVMVYLSAQIPFDQEIALANLLFNR
jgi:hypothetical protein